MQVILVSTQQAQYNKNDYTAKRESRWKYYTKVGNDKYSS